MTKCSFRDRATIWKKKCCLHLQGRR